MISKTLLFSDNCPQPETSMQDAGLSVVCTPKFQNGAILRDRLRDGVLQLHRPKGPCFPTCKGLYYVCFVSAIKGHSWVSDFMDYETAMSTYSELIYEEYI